MIRNASSLLKQSLKLLQSKCILKQYLKIKRNTNRNANNLIVIRPNYMFSTHNHNHEDPLKETKNQIQLLCGSLKQTYPNEPVKVIEQLYKKCQIFVTDNKKAEIFIVFDVISDFIIEKDLVEKYSTFLINSANQNFILQKYKSVQKKCRLALPFQIKKHGQKHKNIAEIYNMLGISLSKLSTNCEQSLQNFQKALQIRKQLFGDSSQAAEVLYNMGIIFQQNRNDLQRAEKKYLQGLNIQQNIQIPNKFLYVRTKLRLLNLQFKLDHNLQKSISNLLGLERLTLKYQEQNVFKSHEMANANMMLSLMRINLGNRHNSKGQYHKAIKYFQSCLQYFKQNNMEGQDTLKTLQSMASCYVNLSQFDQAIIHLEEAQRILANIQPSEQYKFNFLKYVAFVYRQVSNFSKQQYCLKMIKQQFEHHPQKFSISDRIQTSFWLLYSQGATENYLQSIKQGQIILKLLQSARSMPLQKCQLYRANTLCYIGLAYTNINETQKGLKILIQSHELFLKMPPNVQHLQFQLNIIKKISYIYINQEKLQPGYKILTHGKNKIISFKQLSNQSKLTYVYSLLSSFQAQLSDVQGQQAQKHFQMNIMSYLNDFYFSITDLLIDQNRDILQTFIKIPFALTMIYQFTQKARSYDKQQEQLNMLLKCIQRITNIYLQQYRKQIQMLLQKKQLTQQLSDACEKLLLTKEFLFNKGIIL